MEVNNQTLSEQTNPSAEQQTADTIKTVGPGEQNEPAQQNESSEIVQPTQKPPNRVGDSPRYYGPNLQPKRKNGKFTSRKRYNHLANLFKKKSVDPSPTTETIELTEHIEPPPPEPPEQWTTCRLRQNGRELVRNRIKADADYDLSVKLEKKRERSRIAKQRSRLKQLNGFNFVKLEENVDDTDVKIEDCCRRIKKRNGNQRTRKNVRTAETPEQRSLRLERLRITRANETEEQRFVRIERVKMANLKRLVTETEEERSKRLEGHRAAQRRRYWREKNLKAVHVKEEGQQVDIAVNVRDCRQGTGNHRARKNGRSAETPEQRSLRVERLRIKERLRRTNETEEERYIRTERRKMANLKRLVMETEEERSKRLERQRAIQKRRYWRVRLLRAGKVQQTPAHQAELSNSVTESTEEDQKVHTEEFVVPCEPPIQAYTAMISTQINKATNFDVVYNLIHSICRKQHSHQYKQLKNFDKSCKSPSSNYILSTVVWHKHHDRTLTPEFTLL